MNMEFKVGDHVQHIATGEHGVVCNVYRPDWIWVRWDEEKLERHNCNGHCDNRHGWNIHPQNLVLLRIEPIEETPLEILNLENLFT